MTESIGKESNSSESTLAEKESEEQNKKLMDVINASIVKIIKLPSNRRSSKCNIHKKLVRQMFITNIES